VERAIMPVLGNLAWAPDPATERVEILDRFNGVPTLGVLQAPEGDHLYWRVFGYVPALISVWIYAPIDGRDATHLDECGTTELLDGLIFNAPRERYVTVGVAEGNRLVFEREWLLPANLSQPSFTTELTRFLLEALNIALEQALPPGRREVVDRASRAVRELADSGV